MTMAAYFKTTNESTLDLVFSVNEVKRDAVSGGSLFRRR